MLWVGGAAVVVVVVLVWLVTSGGADSSANKNTEPATTRPPAVAKPTPTKAAPRPTEQARAGKPPARPAPPIPASVFEQAETHYQAAKTKWNESVRAKRKGDINTAREAAAAAWQQFLSQRDLLEPYMEWFEEADMEDWTMPADYVRLQRLLNTYDKLKVKVQKMPK